MENGKGGTKGEAEDIRGFANLLALDRCTTVREAVLAMTDYLALHPSSVTGVNFLLSRTGNIGVIEHDGSEIAFRMMTVSPEREDLESGALYSIPKRSLLKFKQDAYKL